MFPLNISGKFLEDVIPIGNVMSNPVPLFASLNSFVPMYAARRQEKVNEQLSKLKVENCDISVGFDSVRNKLRIEV